MHLAQGKESLHPWGRSVSQFLQCEPTIQVTTPPVLDARPSQGYLQHQIHWYPVVHMGGERQSDLNVVLKNTTQCPQPGFKPRLLKIWSWELTTRPLYLHTSWTHEPKKMNKMTPATALALELELSWDSACITVTSMYNVLINIH